MAKKSLVLRQNWRQVVGGNSSHPEHSMETSLRPIFSTASTVKRKEWKTQERFILLSAKYLMHAYPKAG